RIGTRRNQARREQRLDLGREQNELAIRRPLPRPVERADAEAVAGKNELAPALVPERDGELAAQLLQHALAVILPQVWDELRVAVRAELMAFRHQLGSCLRIIEQLAGEDDRDRAVFVVERLSPVRQADDAQSAIGHGQAGTEKVAVLVGSAVED